MSVLEAAAVIFIGGNGVGLGVWLKQALADADRSATAEEATFPIYLPRFCTTSSL